MRGGKNPDAMAETELESSPQHKIILIPTFSRPPRSYLVVSTKNGLIKSCSSFEDL
jgi:hypothetical protein